MKKLFGIFALVTVLTAGAFAAEVVLGPGVGTPPRTEYHQVGSRTLSADTTYVLTGLYYVDSLQTLTIPAGTVIKADTAATLIIYRGAQIFAQGTATNPIIFTSNNKPGQKGRGQWGGVIILGRAPTNQTNPVIEGGIIPGSYGGTLPADNSGTFQYVRIEFPGYRYQLNNEVNGLTMGGVGSGTTIDHVQVSFSDDDSFEWFGGTVNAKNIVAFGGTDDEFDTDFGYQGKVQFVFGLRDKETFDPTGQSNGFESDNEGTASDKAPRTMPYFSNVTMIGPYRVDTVAGVNVRYEYHSVLRRGTKQSLYNSAFAGYPGGFSVRDAQSWTNPEDSMEVQYNSFGNQGSLAAVHTSGGPLVADVTAWLTASNNVGHTSSRAISALGFSDMNLLNDPNPVPGSGSELIGTANFSNPRLSSGFTSVTYKGAFDPTLTLNQQWTAGWTNFNPQYSTFDCEVGWNMISVPALVPNTAATAVFPGKSGNAFSYNTSSQNYDVVSNVVPGQGMWVKYPTKRTIAFGGRTINTTATIVVGGASWVLIGGQSRLVKDITVISGAGTITGNQFKWDAAAQNYLPVNLTPAGAADLFPGEAAWVKVNGACTLQLNY